MDHLRRLLPYIPDVGSPAMRAKLVEMIPHEGLRNMKTFIDALRMQSLAVYRQKQRALEHGDEAVLKQVGEGKDVMSILSERTWPLRTLVSSVTDTGRYVRSARKYGGG